MVLFTLSLEWVKLLVMHDFSAWKHVYETIYNMNISFLFHYGPSPAFICRKLQRIVMSVSGVASFSMKGNSEICTS